MVVGVHSAALEINDDEAEKRDRRLSKMLEMQQRNLVSPATPAERFAFHAFNPIVVNFVKTLFECP